MIPDHIRAPPILYQWHILPPQLVFLQVPCWWQLPQLLDQLSKKFRCLQLLGNHQSRTFSVIGRVIMIDNYCKVWTYVSHFYHIHGELPVALPCDGYICKIPRVVVRVGASKKNFSTHRSVWVSWQVETEHGILVIYRGSGRNHPRCIRGYTCTKLCFTML